MERRKLFKRIGVGVLGAAAVLSLAAFRGGHGRMHHGPGAFFGAHVEEVLDDVDATPEQRQQIGAIVDRLREKGRALHGQRRAEHEKFLAQFEAGTLDQAQLAAHIAARAEEMKAFGNEVAAALVEVQGILTPEQRAKVAKKMQRRFERRPGRGMRGPPSE